jgi:putative chitinase
MAKIDRGIYFQFVRSKPFNGTLTQQQVDGQEYILAAFEERYDDWDPRWLAYCLATTFHETSATMWPISEYGKGEGAAYGEPDPITGQAYYGRGFVQLTWDTNYKRVDQELGYQDEDSCYWHADNQLKCEVAAPTMFIGMSEGWFRTGKDGTKETLQKYFNDTRDDPFGAREIINGDKNKVPSWSNGVSIGNLIRGYHQNFLVAIEASLIADTVPPPTPATPIVTVSLDVVTPPGVEVSIIINGEELL